MDPGWRDRGSFAALLGLRRGVDVLVTGREGHPGVGIELWAGEPGASAGIAVTSDGDAPAGLAIVPPCSCGDVGCANAGRQYVASIPASKLPATMAQLDRLPDVAFKPHGQQLWRDQLVPV